MLLVCFHHSIQNIHFSWALLLKFHPNIDNCDNSRVIFISISLCLSKNFILKFKWQLTNSQLDHYQRKDQPTAIHLVEFLLIVRVIEYIHLKWHKYERKINQLHRNYSDKSMRNIFCYHFKICDPELVCDRNCKICDLH